MTQSLEHGTKKEIERKKQKKTKKEMRKSKHKSFVEITRCKGKHSSG
jgi:hypothetical protein